MEHILEEVVPSSNNYVDPRQSSPSSDGKSTKKVWNPTAAEIAEITSQPIQKKVVAANAAIGPIQPWISTRGGRIQRPAEAILVDDTTIEQDITDEHLEQLAKDFGEGFEDLDKLAESEAVEPPNKTAEDIKEERDFVMLNAIKGIAELDGDNDTKEPGYSAEDLEKIEGMKGAKGEELLAQFDTLKELKDFSNRVLGTKFNKGTRRAVVFEEVSQKVLEHGK